MNKNRYYILGVVVLSLSAVVLASHYQNFGAAGTGTNSQATVLDALGAASASSATVSVASYGQGTKAVRNFLKDDDVVAVTPLPKGADVDTVYYSLGSIPNEIVSAIATSSTKAIPTALEKGYEIEFSPGDATFSIFIYKEPVGSTRLQAMTDLAARLGLEQKDLCDLVTFLWISPLANQFFAAKNVGLAGCPGATALP